MRLSDTYLEVSFLSLGTASLGTALNQEATNRLLDAYADLGGNFLDTAHVYACWVPGGVGSSEVSVGNWIRSRNNRANVIISTKGGHPPIEGYDHRSDFLSSESLNHDVNESLERLQVDSIDLYYLHRDDGITPVDEIIDSLNEIETVRWLGASNWSINRVAQANAYAKQAGKRGFSAIQNQWSLALPTWRPTSDPTVRFIENADRDWCADNGVAIHAYSSTANGFFSRPSKDGAFKELHRHVQELAECLSRTPNQIALAWLLNQTPQVIPILGTTNIEHLTDSWNAANLRLDVASLETLRTP